MSSDFYILDNFETANSSKTLYYRTNQLIDAISQHRDYSIENILHNKDSESDCIVVVVETDGVPTENKVGVLYRERLGIVIPKNNDILLSVLALRKAFPVTIHQNSTFKDEPCSLCLYGEPSSIVMRNWTPNQFLKRIQWWLIKAAKNELHGKDQPLEPLFFASVHGDIVLPHDFSQMSTNNNVYYVHQTISKTKPERITFKVVPKNMVPHFDPNSILPLSMVYVETNAVTHGVIEKEPRSLSELASTMVNRGIDFYEAFKNGIERLVTQEGVFQKVSLNSVVIVKTPIKRCEDGPTETYFYKGYLLIGNPFELGESIGFLTKHEGKYFKTPTIGDNSPTIDNILVLDHQLLLLDVLFNLSPDEARRQSGLEDSGPNITLIGAGALGSAIFEILYRGGWDKWFIVDKDYIRPHNITRHVATDNLIGYSKCDVCVCLSKSIYPEWNAIKTLAIDANDIEDMKQKEVYLAAQIVIDASTSDYPRDASVDLSLPRHISIFLTPNGRAAVLMAEDHERTTTLDSLEAQYYRAIFQDGCEWGESHLGNASVTYTGLGCNDHSTVLSYSAIATYAGILSEQIIAIAKNPNAFILVWQKNNYNNSIDFFNILVNRKIEAAVSNFTVIIDEGLIKSLVDYRKSKLPDETGGILVGYFDQKLRRIFIVDALLPPSDSVGTPTSFVRGIMGLEEIVTDIQKRTKDMVYYIGEWHTHPGSSSKASCYDEKQLQYIAKRMAEDGFPAIQLIISDGMDNFSIYLGEHNERVIGAR